MNITANATTSLPTQGTILAIPIREHEDKTSTVLPGLELPIDQVDAVNAALSAAPHITAATGDVNVLTIHGTRFAQVAVVGVGPLRQLTESAVRAAAAALGRSLGCYPDATVALPASTQASTQRILRAAIEGFSWGTFKYTEPSPGATCQLTVLLNAAQDGPGDTEHAITVAQCAAAAVTWVRRMVETPPSQLTPEIFAAAIHQLATEAGVTCNIWTAEDLKLHNFGGVRGVGAGSRNPPTVVELFYPGNGRTTALGLAGKGITFDAGGLNLKRDPGEISWMKSDMAGAASVAAAVCAAATLKSPRPVHAILPLAENLLGRGATLPGDVLTHPDGTTTEVLDTDNEGRLVLADAVSYLVSQNASPIIDVGTLTDGGAIGHMLWGCWGTDPDLISTLVSCGEETGDPGWWLPLRDEYRTLFDSPVADRTNQARDIPDTGTTAATFLRDFAADTPWAHIDNGSTAYLDADLPPWGAGATGSPTLTLLEYLLTNTPAESLT